ncbi:tetraspanin-18 isoform X2 [Neltuma alba]|uniref:tetraspanin-18 isoform X2 n=1 Tax=Neltuma alba TaxID=207710 RepID=UPI0010A3FD37|nr:tetraspanin-18-like isoform X2 [Prosopis alba]
MRRNCCHAFLAFLLKFLNFLHAFVGVSILLYSIWMINQWNHHIPVQPSPASSPTSSSPSISSNSRPNWGSAQFTPLNLAADTVSRFDGGLLLDFSSCKLPTPWFIYSFMGLGIVLCCITFLGCIAAEVIHSCCLCFYTILISVVLLLEAALVGLIAIDHHWEEDFPYDPTGELDSLRAFIADNIDICKWIGLAVLIIQALSLLLALILRATISPQKADFDNEDDYDVGGRNWEPQLNHPSGQPSGSTKSQNKGIISNIWNSRLRDKVCCMD